MDELAKRLFAGKKLCVMSEKQLRKLKTDVFKVMIHLGEAPDAPDIRCFQSSPNNKLYILPEDFEAIPQEIRNSLNIKDIRTANDPAPLNITTYEQLCKERISIIAEKEYVSKGDMFYRNFSVTKKAGTDTVAIPFSLTPNDKVVMRQGVYLQSRVCRSA